MARYGDLDKLKERLMVGSELDPEPCKGFRSALLAMVDTQEDADVAPVVRCKECKYYCETERMCNDTNGFDRYWEPTDFCSYGKRREVGGFKVERKDAVILEAEKFKPVSLDDFAPVVRCKDCDNWADENGREGLCQVWSDFEISLLRYTPKDGYCSEGERREDA